MKSVAVLVYIIFGLSWWCFPPASGADYSYKMMWPKLDQPWYFNDVTGIAVDAYNNYYVVDGTESLVQKFNSAGVFITQWGGMGTDPGQFLIITDIVVDSSNDVYVLERQNGRIQIFNSNGTFLNQWGGKGNGPDEFMDPRSLAIGKSGNVYVTDRQTNSIKKFTKDGKFLLKWGDQGNVAEQLKNPTGIAVDSKGDVYVADTGNQSIKKYSGDGVYISHRGMFSPITNPAVLGDDYSEIAIDASDMVYITKMGMTTNTIQKFTPDGKLVTMWGNDYSPEYGFLEFPTAIAIDAKGNVLVAEGLSPRIQKFTSNGEYISIWTSRGVEPGQFFNPQGIGVGPNGYIYVADSFNSRIQKFTPNGVFLSQWGKAGSGNGKFKQPVGVTIDSNGFVYVLEQNGCRIQKFTSDGIYVMKWGKEGPGPGEFSSPEGIAVDEYDQIYVADTGNSRIQKFDIDGTFVAQWEKSTPGFGIFMPNRIATDSGGHVYVTGKYPSSGSSQSSFSGFVQKFTSNGVFVKEWQGPGSGLGPDDSVFFSPYAITVDNADNLYIADFMSIQVFTPDGDSILDLRNFGTGPGQFSRVRGIAATDAGDLYITDSVLNKVLVLSPKNSVPAYQPKAIIVAGGGNFPGNNLWDATQLCANYAYNALTYQGYSKDTIQYLSSDTDLDLDANGILDDVDGNATKLNLETAVTSWAADAGDLVLYLTDHGGDNQFRMGETELLSAQELNDWLDEHQSLTGAKVTVIYDACMAGSFLETLASQLYDRIFIAGTSKDQSAHFTSMGQISFSYFFWGNIFNGMSLYDAYLYSRDAVTFAYPGQAPLVNGDGNIQGNEYSDMNLIQGCFIGNGLVSAGDIPVIGAVSDAVTLDGGTQAVIVADNVIDANGINRVWAVITPPDKGTADPSAPVTDLPEIELKKVSNSSYHGAYDGFTKKGAYHVAVFAMDTNGLLSIPKSTSVIQTQGPGYAFVNSTLEIILPCTEFQGDFFEVVLAFYPNALDPSALFWKTLGGSPIPVDTPDCASASADLRITIPKIEYNGAFYQAVLKPYVNPLDPFGLYWELDSAKLL